MSIYAHSTRERPGVNKDIIGILLELKTKLWRHKKKLFLLLNNNAGIRLFPHFWAMRCKADTMDAGKQMTAQTATTLFSSKYLSDFSFNTAGIHKIRTGLSILSLGAAAEEKHLFYVWEDDNHSLICCLLDVIFATRWRTPLTARLRRASIANTNKRY